MEPNLSGWEINQAARQDRELSSGLFQRRQTSFRNSQDSGGKLQEYSLLPRYRHPQSDRYSRARPGSRAMGGLRPDISFQPHAGWQEHHVQHRSCEKDALAPGRIPATRPAIAPGCALVKIRLAKWIDAGSKRMASEQRQVEDQPSLIS